MTITIMNRRYDAQKIFYIIIWKKTKFVCVRKYICISPVFQRKLRKKSESKDSAGLLVRTKKKSMPIVVDRSVTLYALKKEKKIVCFSWKPKHESYVGIKSVCFFSFSRTNPNTPKSPGITRPLLRCLVFYSSAFPAEASL